MMEKNRTSIRYREVGPRDGLQNIKHFIPTNKKIELIELLVQAGCSYIEITAFVSPRWIKQMEDAEIICEILKKQDSVKYSVLVPNMKGLERAKNFPVDEFIGVMSLSEIHNKQNLNKSVEESLSELITMAQRASELNVPMRANLATAFGYVDNEPITTEYVIRISKELKKTGFSGITLCDTTGVANPKQVFELCSIVRSELKDIDIGVHFHQQNGIEFANIYASFMAGIRTFEGAIGGLGGCPFAEGAGGNIKTEQVIKMFSEMGIGHSIDLDKIFITSAYATKLQLEYL